MLDLPNRLRRLASLMALTSVLDTVPPTWAEEALGIQPLLRLNLSDLQAQLLPDIQLLIEPAAIERFLTFMDGLPPDWAEVYGQGHHDPELDERLFKLNRERDTQRQHDHAVHGRIAFLWSGELSAFDPETGGFRIALGPKFILTSWGVVRFKFEDVPGNLIAVAPADQREALKATIEQGRLVEIDVVMAGSLIPDESIVYDFSHEEEGMGLIMPVIRVDQLLYLISPQPF